MHGRDHEREVVLGMLRAAEAGHGGVLLVEGPPGIGKSRLLREAAEAAASRGFFVASGAGEQAPELMPASGYLPLLWTPRPKGLGPGRQAGQETSAHGRPAISQDAPGTALVVFDDVHSAQLVMLRQLRGLSRRLRNPPALWILARTTGSTGTDAERLFTHLQDTEAVTLALSPLGDRAAAEMVADVLGVPPEQALADLAVGAGGNPLLIAELLAGLRDEHQVQIGPGAARLLSRRLPQRVRLLVRRWLHDLGTGVSHFLEVGAVLGRSFQVDTVASLLGETPASVLPELEAALAAGILAATGDAVSFAQTLLWRAIVESLPVTARQALHRQAGEFMLGRGGPAAVAAKHLITGSGLCNPHALAQLERAARTMLTPAPRTAAELAISALALTGPADTGRVARMVTAVEALIAAMRLTEAEHVARMALAGPVPAAAAARLRGLLASAMLYGGQTLPAAQQADSVLAQRGPAGRVRAEAEYVLMLGRWPSAGDRQLAKAHAASVLAANGKREDVAITGALLVEAMSAWQEGRIRDALARGREAVQRGGADTSAARRAIARIILTSMLTPLGLLDEAREISLGQPWAAAPCQFDGCGALEDILQGQIALAAGDAAEAVARSERGLRDASERGCHLLSVAGRSVLAIAALRAGDHRAAARHIESCQAHMPEYGTGLGAERFHLASAQVAQANSEAESAAPIVAALVSRAAHDGGVLLSDPAAASWLTRFTLSQRDREHAQQISAAASALAASNPGFTCTVAAAHARGLLDGDAEALRLAAARHSDAWAAASAAEDLGVLLRERDRLEASRSLEQALAGYERTGAVRDMRRVRGRLRGLGIRRRHFTYANRPRSGWASLTETERTVSGLVAQGLTNQQVAAEMFLSMHTVAFHLRQIYRKLDISSRVDLARILTERGTQLTAHGPPEGGPPGGTGTRRLSGDPLDLTGHTLPGSAC